MPRQTNVAVGSFNNGLESRIGAMHPNSWTFLDGLTKGIDNKQKEIMQLKAGATIRRPRTKQNKVY